MDRYYKIFEKCKRCKNNCKVFKNPKFKTIDIFCGKFNNKK